MGTGATGNWQAFKQDTDGNGTWDLVQSRTANKANEITAINNTTGTAWVTPGYDKAGNMIGIPNPTISSTATYDAWNRLIGVTDASTSITNDYDARGFRITETTGGVVRHYYYTPGWQCVEERTGTLTIPERQFVWGMRYIDDLVIRDRSTANNGSINERRYAMQDGNWNTVVTPRSSPAFSSSWMRAPAGSNCFTSLALSFAECVFPESTSLSSSLCLRFAAAYGHTGRGCRPSFRGRGTRNTPLRRLV